MAIAEIISIGDEITIGKILDTNSQWLSRRLTELGVRVLYHTTVGDDVTAMLDVFRKAALRADLILATGGLGPTADDLTREAIAVTLGVPLVQDEELLQGIRNRFQSRGSVMPPANAVQALMPQGSVAIPNPNGTAPGIDVTFHINEREVRLCALPGVPAEMREMWNATLAGRLASHYAKGQVIKSRSILTFGAGESQVEQMLPNLVGGDHDPRVGITADDAVITLTIVAERESEAACDAAIDPIAAFIYEKLGKLIFGEGTDTLPGIAIEELRRRNETLATVEFGTGGLLSHDLAHELTLRPDGPTCYHGGLANLPADVLQQLLTAYCCAGGICMQSPKQNAQQHVADIAATARRFFGTDHLLVVGQYPTPALAADAPPLVWLAHDHAKGVDTQSFPFAGHPALLDQLFVKRAINMLRHALVR
jgi:nicotinamide-nucleotide amidase